MPKGEWGVSALFLLTQNLFTEIQARQLRLVCGFARQGGNVNSIRKMLIAVVSAAIFALLLLPGSSGAQGLASLNGTVTDATGTIVPDATVKLQSTRTGVTLSTQTASDGGYRFVDVPPGPGYALTVTKDGFQTLVLNGIYLPTSTATTKDAQLAVGQVTQTVEVTAETGAVTLNTTDATIGNAIDMNAVANLPNEFRDTPGNLLRLAVGVASAQTTAGNAITSNIDVNHTRDGAVAGARADQNNITVDGIEATDFALGQAFNVEAAIPVDAIQEFTTQVAQPSAAYGGRSGAQTNIVTKSGTNSWHGSAYEYNRTAATEANTFFNKLAKQPRLALVRNQFGANLGGPVLKDKLFFFFEYDGRRDASGESLLQFVPYPHVKNGSIAYINNSAGCDANARLTAADVSTNCVTILPAAQVAQLDPCSTAGACANAPGFVAAGQAPALASIFKSRYPAPNDYSVGDGLNIAGLRFNAPSPLTENGYLARIDYNLSANNKLFGRFNIRNESTVDNNPGYTPIQFPGDALTALQTLRDRAWVFGDTWTITPSLINQFTYGETRANDAFPTDVPAAGSLYALTFFGSSQNQTFATPFVRQGSQGRVIPDPTFRDDVTWTHGKHTLQFGAEWNPSKVRNYIVNDLTFIQEGLGGDITGLDNPVAGQPSAWRPADILPADNTNWDNFFLGDLGVIWNYQNAINYTNSGTALPPGSTAARDWRITNLAGYVQDSWRAFPNLTITGGVRYQYQTAPYEVHGTEAQFFNTSVDAILKARQTAGAQGLTGVNAVPLMTYALAGKENNAKPLYDADKLDFSPRLSLAWNPSFSDGLLGKTFGEHKTVIRAGAGLIYDQSVAWAMTNFEDQSNYLFTNTVGGLFNQQKPTLFALENDPRMNSVSKAPFTITPPPFQKSVTPFAVFNDGINPILKTPYSITASFGIQRELPAGFQLEADYYGRFGRRMFLLADVGQGMDFTDPASKQTLVQAFTTLENASRANNGAGLPSVPDQPVLENQMNAAIAANPAAFSGATSCTQAFGSSCTTNVYNSQFSSLQQGATGEIFASIPLPVNVGLTPQFFVNAPVANKGFSSYNGLFLILRKRLSDNLQLDFNYAYSHSIDNGSTISNENGNFEPGDTSVMCDVTNNRACRGSSEFDLTHQISADFVYSLPFGRGQRFGGNASTLLNEAIGGWEISGIETWHSGFAYTVNNTDIAFYDTVSLAADTGMLFTGSKSALASNIHMDPVSNSVQFYVNPTLAGQQFSAVTGLQSGDRDILRGPHFSNLDLSLAKTFPLASEKYNLRLQIDAYNAFNHPNFGLPDTGVISGSFGVIRGLIGQEPSRVMQFALRFNF